MQNICVIFVSANTNKQNNVGRWVRVRVGSISKRSSGNEMESITHSKSVFSYSILGDRIYSLMDRIKSDVSDIELLSLLLDLLFFRIL